MQRSSRTSGSIPNCDSKAMRSVGGCRRPWPCATNSARPQGHGAIANDRGAPGTLSRWARPCITLESADGRTPRFGGAPSGPQGEPAGVESTRGPSMPTPKRIAQEVIEGLPDDCTFTEIEYRLKVRELIEEGREDVRQGRVVSQEEIERDLEQWLTQ